jgi:hypothetical protein
METRLKASASSWIGQDEYPGMLQLGLGISAVVAAFFAV